MAELKPYDGSPCRCKSMAALTVMAGAFVYAAALALTIMAFSLPARTIAGTWICDDYHGGTCTIKILPGGTCAMRYESERGVRRGVYDLSGLGTCSVYDDNIEFVWERITLDRNGHKHKAPKVSRSVAKLNGGSASFTWVGLTFERLEARPTRRAEP
ncbi:MAG: hypothetical protein IJ087_05425 [Eggerthellaceae bacterium]|nr:hypothetical protein [Eggerthellaceae bacterium]